MNVEFSDEAEEQFLFIDAWWRRQRRAAPDLFEEELKATLERARVSPKLGIVYDQNELDETVYRVLLPRTHHHVYYALRGNSLVVLAVWGASKQYGPRL